MMINRREFLLMTSALSLYGMTWKKNSQPVAKVLPQSSFFSARIDGKKYFVLIDPSAPGIKKIPAIGLMHSLVRDGDLFYSIEKRGTIMEVFNFDHPEQKRVINPPPEILFYGHGLIHRNKLIVTSVKTHAGKSNGVLLVYDKKILKLISQVEVAGDGLHDLVIHQGKLFVSSFKNLRNKSSLLVFNLNTLELEKEYEVADKDQHLKFRHFAFDKDNLYITFGAYADNGTCTSAGVWEYKENAPVEITEYTNHLEPEQDYDQTTTFAKDGSTYVVLCKINKMIVFKDKKATLVEFKAGTLQQLHDVIKIKMGYEINDALKGSKLSTGNFYILGHILTS